jgi:hypothetical protein
MSHSIRRHCAALLAAGLCLPSVAFAHGVIGERFFPATISSDDPFAADELALPTISHFNHETDYDMDYSKSIVPGFAIGVGIGYVDAKEPGAAGFGNLELSPALELIRSAGSEFILSVGFDWEIGGTGSASVAERTSTYAPTLKYGKGFGDLPENLAYLRPLAVTGTLGYETGAGTRSIEWAGAVEYSLLYLQNNVKDRGLDSFTAHLTPVMEYAMSSPTNGGGTTGTINPGLIWSGQQEQFALEAMIPVNHASGGANGVIAQLHFYIDDILPHSLGTPIFGGPP